MPCDLDLIGMGNLAVIGARINLHTTIVAQVQALWISAFFDGRIPKRALWAIAEQTLKLSYASFCHTEY